MKARKINEGFNDYVRGKSYDEIIEPYITEISEWVYHDVSKEQIKTVLWALMMEDDLKKLTDILEYMRQNYEDEYERSTQ